MPRRRRRSPRARSAWLKTVLLLFAAPPLLYLAAALIGGLASVNAGWVEPDDGVTVYLADNGIHVDLILPVAAQGLDWRDVISPDDVRQAPTQPAYVAFGSGERAVYLETPTWAHLKAKTALRALTRGQRTLHVEWLADARLAERQLRLRPAEYRRLFQAVRDGFDGDPRLIAGRGYGAIDAFYESRGRANAVLTCNQWIASRLRLAGVRAPLWSPFPAALMARYRPYRT